MILTPSVNLKKENTIKSLCLRLCLQVMIKDSYMNKKYKIKLKFGEQQNINKGHDQYHATRHD